MSDLALPPANRDSLFAYLSEAVDGQPRYRTWEIFPSHADRDTANYPKEYFLKRLGLPVHGRWVSTYVNPIAYDFLIDAISVPPDSVLEMPLGSIIVKENYRTDEFFKPFDNPDMALLEEGAAPRPAVLTVLYKDTEERCGTGYRFNGTDCFGGTWLWSFFGLNPISVQLDALIEPESFCINCHAPAFDSDYLRSLLTQRKTMLPSPSPERELRPSGSSPTPAELYCEGLTAASPVLPEDVPANPTTVSDAQKMFDCLSWRTFVALSWPADSTDRGQPNTSIRSVSDAAFLQGPRVWETYKETYAVFQPDSLAWVPDSSWNAPQPVPQGEGCEILDGNVLSMISKSHSRSADVANETGQAFAGSFGTLQDQNGNLVRYEVRFNRDEFDYIISTGSAVTRNLTPVGPPNATLPDNLSGDYGGSIEIKAAWREMCLEPGQGVGRCFPTPDDTTAYYTRNVLLYHPQTDSTQARCESKLMGLVALHVAHKTQWAPQWVWSTFSFYDNVPDATDPAPRSTPFYDSTRTAPEDCWMQPFLISAANCPNVELNRFLQPPGWRTSPPGPRWPGTQRPNQVTRLAPIEGSGLNETFGRLLAGTPFENYRLLNTQWPFHGRDQSGQVNVRNCPNNAVGPDCYTMIPRYLRNPVVETYMSTYNYQRQQYSNRSCMGCHGDAATDFSYIWLDGVEQVVPIG